MEPEPTSTPSQPAPIMDVAPPTKSAAGTGSQLAQPPAEQDKTAATTPTAVPDQKEVTKPKAPKSSTTPTAAISFAIIFFVVLSALAYYAYTKAK